MERIRTLERFDIERSEPFLVASFHDGLDTNGFSIAYPIFKYCE